MLYLSGGGDEKDSILIDTAFARENKNKRLIYIPLAMDGNSPTYVECENWIKSIFTPLGMNEIVMWDDTSFLLNAELKEDDTVYIGGGNTYQLLDMFRKTGFDRVLSEFILSGGSVYGGSAGAIILAKDISTAAPFDRNEVSLVDTSGLGLVGQYSIWCHYSSEHEHMISDFTFTYPIIAIPERSGIIVSQTTIEVVGFDPVILFEKDNKQILMPNDRLNLE